jgi:hypothetical protein
MLPVMPMIELVLTPVSALTELVMLDEELETFEELRDSIDCLTVTGLSVSSLTPWADTPAHSARPTTATIYLIAWSSSG